jgi:hypothetical protein
MSAWYPEKPSIEEQKSMTDFIQGLSKFYPCTVSQVLFCFMFYLFVFVLLEIRTLVKNPSPIPFYSFLLNSIVPGIFEKIS